MGGDKGSGATSSVDAVEFRSRDDALAWLAREGWTRLDRGVDPTEDLWVRRGHRRMFLTLLPHAGGWRPRLLMPAAAEA